MPKTLEEKMRNFSPAERKRISTAAARIVKEETTLRELRRTLQITQAALAEELGISQNHISKLEKRNDCLVSTLRKTILAMGGELSVIARFRGREPVTLSGLGEVLKR